MARSSSGLGARCASARSRRSHSARTRRSPGATFSQHRCSGWLSGDARRLEVRPEPRGRDANGVASSPVRVTRLSALSGAAGRPRRPGAAPRSPRRDPNCCRRSGCRSPRWCNRREWRRLRRRGAAVPARARNNPRRRSRSRCCCYRGRPSEVVSKITFDGTWVRGMPLGSRGWGMPPGLRARIVVAGSSWPGTQRTFTTGVSRG